MNIKTISNDAYKEYVAFAKSRGYQTIPKDIWIKLVWGF
jgi:hypothetical protein